MPDNELEPLLARAREGDRDALADVYDHYSPAVYRFLYRRCGDPHLAEDLTAKAFLKVLEAIQSDQAWRTSFSGWLYRLARNLLTDHLRKRGRHPETEMPPTMPAGDDVAPERHALREGQAAELRRVMDQLRPQYAQVLLLRFAEGMTHREAAEALGMTESAVKVAQHRALKELRRRLGPRFAESLTE